MESCGPADPADSRGNAGDPSWIRLLALVLAVVAAAYVVQNAVLERYVDGRWVFSGSSSYGRLAEQWIDTGVLRNSRPPAYPVFLGLNVAIWGRESYVPAVIVLQAATAWVTLVALFLVAQRATERAAWGLLAVGLVSLNELWVVGSIGQVETFLYAAILMALAGLLVCTNQCSRWFLVAAGVLCGMGWLTRPTGIVLLPALVATLWRDWGAASARRRVQAAGVLSLSFGLPVILWVGYQHVHYGSVAISGRSNAVNLLKGNNGALAATYPFIDVDRLTEPLIRNQIDVEAERRGVDRRQEYYRQAFRFMTSSPLEALALVPRKLAAFFVPVRFPLGRGTPRQDVDGEWQIDDYLARPIGRGDGIMALPGVLAFFAALVWWRKLTNSGRFIALAVGLTAIIHVVTFAQTRFRLPYDPLLALLFVQMTSSVLSPQGRQRR